MRACVYIYIVVYSLWFIDLTFAAYHMQYTFLSYADFFTSKRTKHENTRHQPFSYDTKIPADGYRARKALKLRGLLLSLAFVEEFEELFLEHLRTLTSFLLPQVRRGAGVLASKRRIGPELSRRVHLLFTAQDSELPLK